jgi:hypothetical protein
MALDKNKTTRLVHFPDGKVSHEIDTSVTGTVEFLARNKKTIIELASLTGVATINLATTFVSDPDDTTYNIIREEGFELILYTLADAARVITLGTGFGTAASVSAAATVKVFKFEYINGLFELVE